MEPLADTNYTTQRQHLLDKLIKPFFEKGRESYSRTIVRPCFSPESLRAFASEAMHEGVMLEHAMLAMDSREQDHAVTPE